MFIWLVPLLSGIFQALINFFVQHFSLYVARIIAAIALFVAMTVAFVVTINGLLAGITLAVPSEMSTAISWFMPSNLPVCIAAYYSAVLARWLYDMKVKIIKAWYGN